MRSCRRFSSPVVLPQIQPSRMSSPRVKTMGPNPNKRMPAPMSRDPGKLQVFQPTIPPIHTRLAFKTTAQPEWQRVESSQASPAAPAYAPPHAPNGRQTDVPAELPAVSTPAEEPAQLSFGENRTSSWNTAEVFDVPQKGQSPLPPVTSKTPDPSERPVSTWWMERPNNKSIDRPVLDESAQNQPQPPQSASHQSSSGLETMSDPVTSTLRKPFRSLCRIK